MFNLYYF
ncbi:hypothetical protein BIW11_11301 [Tropilaelaps mercedesae]|nr:hypothetical protein BIW11_11301 [Tropilaelaps mercedesae]